METVSTAIANGDKLLTELQGAPAAPATAATMGRLQKCSYSHKAMIDLILEHPQWTQNQLAAHFGYTPGWISNVLASEAFQSMMALRREEIIDLELKASIKERFEALVIRSLTVLQEKLNSPQVSDQVAMRCAELGAKALGVGGHATPPPPENSEQRLERLARRLLALREPQGVLINGEATIIQDSGHQAESVLQGTGGV